MINVRYSWPEKRIGTLTFLIILSSGDFQNFNLFWKNLQDLTLTMSSLYQGNYLNAHKTQKLFTVPTFSQYLPWIPTIYLLTVRVKFCRFWKKLQKTIRNSLALTRKGFCIHDLTSLCPNESSTSMLFINVVQIDESLVATSGFKLYLIPINWKLVVLF